MDPPLQSIDTLGGGPSNVYLTIVNLDISPVGFGGLWKPSVKMGSLQEVFRMGTYEVIAYISWIYSAKRDTVKGIQNLTRNPR